VLDRCHRIKIDAKHFAGIFTPDFASAMTGITNMYGTMRLGGRLARRPPPMLENTSSPASLCNGEGESQSASSSP
jgi:hypothetical protein